MILFLLPDLQTEDWEYTSTNLLFNNLIVFLNAFCKSSRNNRVVVIGNREVVFDTNKDNISEIYRIAENQSCYDVNDLGYALCLQRDERAQILIFSLKEERPEEYLRYLKCMFAAQRAKVRVDAFSLFENRIISQCCASTGGYYSTSEESSMRFLLSLLGTGRCTSPTAFPTNCYCHDKQVLLGLVCPICLAVFCRFTPICKKCKSKFSFER